MERATLTRNQQSLVLASTQGRLDLVGALRRIRRIFGPMGGGSKKDVLAVIGEPSNEGALQCVAPMGEGYTSLPPGE